MINEKSVLILFFLIGNVKVYSQSCISTFKISDFNIAGDASIVSNEATLTPNLNNQSGMIWSNYKIDLDKNFKVDVDLYLGDNNNGADGIAFVIQPLSKDEGSLGGGIGYAGIAPSFAVEFDTYENLWADQTGQTDDHAAIIINGNTQSNHSAIAPFSNLGNVEDGNYHRTVINWDALTKKFSMTFDGALKFELIYDIKNQVFAGNSEVYWGFTAATGGAKNTQKVKFIEYCQTPAGCDAFPEISSNAKTIVFGQSSLLSSSSTSSTFLWSNGSTASTISVQPTSSTTYTLAITKNGITCQKEILIDVLEDSDSDGVADSLDQCLNTSPGSTVDSIGCSECQKDNDVDGIFNCDDNCINVENPDQKDTDNDGFGDFCDLDDDNDGLSDVDEILLGTNPLLPDTDLDSIKDLDDLFPLDPNETSDFDEDGIGDNSDNDDDNDNYLDKNEIKCFSDPLNNEETPADFDNDFIPDCIDLDDDNDGILDSVELSYLNKDFDNDLFANNIDLDSDGDGCSDVKEAGFNDTDSDGFIGIASSLVVDEKGLVISEHAYIDPLDSNENLVHDYLEFQDSYDENIMLTSILDYVIGDPVLFKPFGHQKNAEYIYQWQRSIDDGKTYSNITNTNEFSGFNSQELLLKKVDLNYNKNLFRLILTPYFVCGKKIISNPTKLLYTELFVPNLITPNGDGINDFLEIRGLMKYKDYKLEIFTRLGIRIYESKNYFNDWNGNFNGSPLPEGTYYYLLYIRQKVRKGFIYLKKY